MPHPETAMITGSTKIFCILADPIGHVKTPQMFNAYLAKIQADAVLVPAHVKSEKLAELVNGLRSVVNLRGIVVTVPHKIAILDLCDELDPSARMVGAVNILRREPDGRLIGGNFDGIGFLRSLEASVGKIVGKSVFLAGAGGVARAIAFSIAGAGVSRLAVYNRSREKGAELLAAIGRSFPEPELEQAEKSPETFDIVINATSLGLRPDDALPFSIDGLASDAVVAEVVMQPVMTPLLLAAKARGLRIVTGEAMLEFQLNSWVEFIENGASKESLRTGMATFPEPEAVGAG